MCVASALISVTTDVSATGDLLVTSWHETSLQEWVRGQRNKGQLAMTLFVSLANLTLDLVITPSCRTFKEGTSHHVKSKPRKLQWK